MSAADKYGGIVVGSQTTFAKTFTEADAGFFCAISGDFDPIHVDEAYAATTQYGRRIAHGLAVLGLLSPTESEIGKRAVANGSTFRPVSLGYEGVRFLAPVFIGDSLKAIYTIESIDEERNRMIGDCKIVKHDGTLCIVGKHIMKWLG